MKKSKRYHKKVGQGKLKRMKPVQVRTRSKLLIVGILIALGFIVSVYFLWQRNRNEKLSYYKSILQASMNTLGVSTSPSEVTIDFSKQIAVGSPLIFGGAHTPNVQDQDVWNELQNIGVTLIRRDFFVEYSVPNNITLSDYKNNKNDVQNPNNWNTSFINETKARFQNAKDRGMKIVGIVAYAPSWLTYSGKEKAVPRDWDVYEDIIKKLYRIYRPYVNYLEVWNEPDLPGFFDVSGSGLSKEVAYQQIYSHVVKAIREVDEEIGDKFIIPIGGTAVSNPERSAFLAQVLSDPTTRNNIDFVSYHGYANLDSTASRSQTIALFSKYRNSTPTFYVSEWNRTGNPKQFNNYTNTNLAIPYTGSRLIGFLNSGVSMASYFSLKLNDPKHKQEEIQSYGFYTKVNGKNILFPQAKTWRLMSKTLGLGLGKSTIYQSSIMGDLATAGFINSEGINGAIISNTSGSTVVNVNISGIKLSGSRAIVNIFIASKDSDGINPFCSEIINIKKDIIAFKTVIPEQSLLGITFANPTLSMNTLLNTLGITTTADCLEEL